MKEAVNVGRAFWSLWALSNFTRSRMVAKCLNAAIRVAMDAQDFETAAALRDLRAQLVDAVHGEQPLEEPMSFETMTFTT